MFLMSKVFLDFFYNMSSKIFKIKVCEKQTNINVMNFKLCGKEMHANFEDLRDKYDLGEVTNFQIDYTDY